VKYNGDNIWLLTVTLLLILSFDCIAEVLTS